MLAGSLEAVEPWSLKWRPPGGAKWSKNFGRKMRGKIQYRDSNFKRYTLSFIIGKLWKVRSLTHWKLRKLIYAEPALILRNNLSEEVQM